MKSCISYASANTIKVTINVCVIDHRSMPVYNQWLLTIIRTFPISCGLIYALISQFIIRCVVCVIYWVPIGLDDACVVCCDLLCREYIAWPWTVICNLTFSRTGRSYYRSAWLNALFPCAISLRVERIGCNAMFVCDVVNVSSPGHLWLILARFYETYILHIHARCIGTPAVICQQHMTW